MHGDLIISQTDGRPMYVQIMDHVRRRIAVGDWNPGEQIPSIRELAIAARVSVITVKRAYLELEREGVIVTQQGRGSFVAERPDLRTGLQERELTEHLEKAVECAALLGLTREELRARLEALHDEPTKE